ncbi:MAG TPA: nitroreductase family protein [Actinomycetota bacterium]
MELQRAIDKRRMWRNFDPDRPVPRAALERILRNALHAPSAGFSQGWAFLVLTEPEDRARFWDAEWPADERGGPLAGGIMRAPALIVPMSNKEIYLDRYAEPDKGWTDRDEARWPVPFWHLDTAFASMLMLLTVVDEGLGALFFGVRRASEFRDAFGAPEAYTPIGAIALGYGAPDAPSPSLARGRREPEQVIHYGRWKD